jgi:hypothetical protein
MEDRSAPTIATKTENVNENGKRGYAGAKAGFLERNTLLPESTAGANDGEPNLQIGNHFDVASDEVMEVPYVDWIAPFLLGCLRQWDGCEDELSRMMDVANSEAVRPEAIRQALDQMEEADMIFSEPVGFGYGPSRRRYAITGLGEAYLEFMANALAQYRKEMDLFFRIYEKQRALEQRDRSAGTSG